MWLLSKDVQNKECSQCIFLKYFEILAVARGKKTRTAILTTFLTILHYRKMNHHQEKGRISKLNQNVVYRIYGLANTLKTSVLPSHRTKYHNSIKQKC